MTTLGRLVRRRDQALPRVLSGLRRRGLVHQPVGSAGPRAWIAGRPVLNFTAAGYLGLERHPSVRRAACRAVERWGVSLATPRVLAEHPLTARLERALAHLVGQEAALVFPSTSHVALDVLPLLAGPAGLLAIDERAYAISREGAGAAAQAGALVVPFPHNDAGALGALLRRHARLRDKAIVCDGVYPAGGYPAALAEFVSLARRHDAAVYVDDAHGLGLLGAGPAAEPPYGSGGGGTPPHLGIPPGELLHVGSLSKAFGVPVAFVAGPAEFIAYLRLTAGASAHSSPPAIPTIAAALAALEVHAARGDALRRRLAARVRQFRAGLAAAGVPPRTAGLFPIQALTLGTPRAVLAVGQALRCMGVWSVVQLHAPECPRGGVLRFILTALHGQDDIGEAVAAIARACATRPA